MDGDEALGKCQLCFGLREISFRTYHDYDFGTIESVKDLLDAAAWNSFVFKAVGDQLQSVVLHVPIRLDEFLDRYRLIDSGNRSLEGLFGSADQDLFYAGGLQHASFRMLSNDRRKLIEPYLACLFREPFVTVVVLCRTYGKMKPVRVRAPSFLGRKDHCFHAFGTVGRDAATVQCSASVDHGYLVSASVAENLYAMSGLVLVQSADAAVDVSRKEKFHFDEGNEYANIIKMLILQNES